jgi:hypothetical protein
MTKSRLPQRVKALFVHQCMIDARGEADNDENPERSRLWGWWWALLLLL